MKSGCVQSNCLKTWLFSVILIAISSLDLLQVNIIIQNLEPVLKNKDLKPDEQFCAARPGDRSTQ